jgi:uncharacterized protein YgiM (DUF1202 family)
MTDQFPVIATVLEDNLRVRSAPTLDAKILGEVMKGQSVYVKDRTRLPQPIGEMSSYWYRVTTRDGLNGYCYGYYLDVPPYAEKPLSFKEFEQSVR